MTILAAGAFAPKIYPKLAKFIKASGQAVVHVQVPDAIVPKFSAPDFTVWAAEITTIGFYGFPLITKDGKSFVKIAHHGVGLRHCPNDNDADVTCPTLLLDNDGIVVLDKDSRILMKDFIARAFPELVDQPWVKQRLCWYADSLDGDFLFDYVPETNHTLLVLTGDSGHAFKFGPLLTDIFKKVIHPNSDNQIDPIYEEAIKRFKWRDMTSKKESSRSEN